MGVEPEKIVSADTGAFNIYIAGSDFCIIPDFDMPDDYIATERVWYTGACKNNGKPYVSSPYQDAMTGEICYSVSVMLGDGDAVLSVDYTMEGIRGYISQMESNAVNAVIVTDEGVIAGCSDEALLGKKLMTAMPDYTGIYFSVKNKEGVTTARLKDGFFYDNAFAARSGQGWFLIVSISDWELYRNSYIQLSMTILLSLALFAIIITLYLSAQKSREKAEKALATREAFLSSISRNLTEPLNKILERSHSDNASLITDYREEMASIHAAGESLSEMIGQIISYNSIFNSEKKDEQDSRRKGKTIGLNKRFRAIILAILFICMCLSLYINISSEYRWGNAKMQNEASEYEYELSEWINTQKSILDMFVSVISTNPEMLSDYSSTVRYLDEITKQYPEISVTYMTNPELEHTVYMNNGWEPDADWHVEERQWYIDTLASESGWNVSAPYYDEQTGGYCLTISEIVYDAKTGEFLGIFGIDFFMDKLVDILGGSYSDAGYAFLVDPYGEIINHPYGAYQMTQENSTNVQNLSYSEIKADGKTTCLFTDYDGAKKILIAVRNEQTNFTVYVVSDTWKIYGTAVVYSFICIVIFMFCIFLIYRQLTDFIGWQNKTNRRLKEAADAAIAAGNAKDTFLAQMSHEIRTPINAILGMNEMIIRESNDEEITDYAENVRSAGKTLLSLINSILDFSKIENGKMELDPVKYDVPSLLNDLVNSVSERAKNKGLAFELDADRTLPRKLFGDDVRISQVIMNLLTNAVKYSEEGKVTLSVHGKKINEKSMLLCVSVKDTGIGIRKEDMDKLFESFGRLDVTRNRSIEGTGLGMSIVTKLLEMMGSSLKVESEYGKGSEFSFELLQDIVDPEPIGDFAETVKKGTVKSEQERYPFAPDAKILVVDDNDMNRSVVRNLLKRNGIVPDKADSGAAAIEKISSNRYDIVLLDHMMPKMDGIETLQHLKKNGLIPEDCVVIALTANAISGAREQYLDAGFDDYLSKPIEVIQLERKLAAYLPENTVTWKNPAKEKAESREEAHNEKAENAPSDDVMEFDAYPEDDNDILEFGPDEFDEDLNSEAKSTQDHLTAELGSIGLDVETALSFCGDDFDFYTELLEYYVKSSKDKEKQLLEYCEGGLLHEFEIEIHALKSVSKTIGASALSQEALSLEDAAQRNDSGYIRKTLPQFLSEYRSLAEKIQAATEMNG